MARNKLNLLTYLLTGVSSLRFAVQLYSRQPALATGYMQNRSHAVPARIQESAWLSSNLSVGSCCAAFRQPVSAASTVGCLCWRNAKRSIVQTCPVRQPPSIQPGISFHLTFVITPNVWTVRACMRECLRRGGSMFSSLGITGERLCRKAVIRNYQIMGYSTKRCSGVSPAQKWKTWMHFPYIQ